MSSTDRVVWLEARRKISEYEIRKAELRLDEQREQRVLETEKERLENLQRDLESADCQQLAMAAEANDLRKNFIETEKKQGERESDCQLLRKQIIEMKEKVETIQQSLKTEECFFASHIKKQEDFIDQWEDYIAAEKKADC